MKAPNQTDTILALFIMLSFRGMLRRISFGFTTVTKSFYMRKLPDQYIRLASEEGTRGIN